MHQGLRLRDHQVAHPCDDKILHPRNNEFCIQVPWYNLWGFYRGGAKFWLQPGGIYPGPNKNRTEASEQCSFGG